MRDKIFGGIQPSEQNDNRVAIISDKGERITYGELWKKGELLKDILQTRSVAFIICDYDIETVSFYYQAMHIGSVPLLLQEDIDFTVMEKLIYAYEPQYLWVKNEYVKQMKNCEIILQGERHALLKTNYKIYEIYGDLSLLLLTSGSTGSAKTVRLCERNLEENARALIEALNVRTDDRGITTLPMNFCYGLSLLHMHWKKGATVLITNRKVYQKQFWQFFNIEKATNFQGVPYTYELLDKIGFLKKDFKSLRFATECGAKLPQQLTELLLEKLKLHILYGQTEGTMGLSCLPHDEQLKAKGSVGRPIGDWKVKVENIAESGAGELVFRGSMTSLGYATSKLDLGLSDSNQGILQTGDLGIVNQHGYIYLTGRKSRFVKLAGTRVSLDDIESIVKTELDFNARCACVGIDDQLYIYIAGSEKEIEYMRKVLAEKLKTNKNFIFVNYIERMPRTSSGKINYAVLKEKFNGR